MKQTNSDSEAYDIFYMELSPPDYLDDIEIQDEYEEPAAPSQGLSDEQVSEIARDSLSDSSPKHNHSNSQDIPSSDPAN